MMRRRRTAILTLLLTPTLLLGACGGDDDDAADTTRAPLVTTADEAATFDLLLTQEDMEGVLGVDAVEVSDTKDVASMVNPDTRGPCGAVVTQPEFQGGAGRAYRGGTLVLLETVSDSGPEQEAQVAAMLADSAVPCGPYEATTRRDTAMTVADIEVADLTALGVPAVGWVNTIDVDGRSLHAATAYAITGGHILMVQAQGPDPYSVAQLQMLTQLAVTRATP